MNTHSTRVKDVTVAPRKFLSLDALCAFRTWLSRPDGRGAAAASRSSGSLPPLMGEHLIEGGSLGRMCESGRKVSLPFQFFRCSATAEGFFGFNQVYYYIISIIYYILVVGRTP